MKSAIAVLLLGVVVATQAFRLHPVQHHVPQHVEQDEDCEDSYEQEENHHHQKWNGPIHVPVIDHHGVPTETPEVRHAKAHLLQKLAEAKKHSHYQHEEEDKWSNDGHHYHVEEHHNEHHQPKWTGPVHVPVIKHGVPTETPEVRHAKAHLLEKLAEAKKHSHYHHEEEENKWSNDGHHYHVEEHHNEHHHHQPKWTGPVHVPVIEHGVPTETPEVRHAKAHLLKKFAEAKSHPQYHEEKEHHSHGGWSDNHQYAEEYHHGNHRWTGPIHVPVLDKHGVPTETPEVRHAKAHLLKKFAEAKAHPEYHSHEEEHHSKHHGGWSDNHQYAKQHGWTGPIHVPVLDKHGVPTETPEVRHAKAHLLKKIAEAKAHPEYHNHEEHEEKKHQKWFAPAHQHIEHHQAEHRHAEHHQAEHHQAEHHHEHRWTGPIHVPVLDKHGVPTETPEVRKAKAHLQAKLEEAKHLAGPEDDCDDEEENHYEQAHSSHGSKWTGPVHVPVLKHGVPTETPEVRHARAQHHHKIAEVKSHPTYSDSWREDYQEEAHHAARFVGGHGGHKKTHWKSHKSHY
ncbi:hypothetical protein DMENIID0001_040260 [Sergentomyia squamirostris]